MFSGIVEETAQVLERQTRSAGATLIIESRLDHSTTAVGDSIAIDGVCLTVTEISGNKLSFDLLPETLRVTTLGSLLPGAKVNVERSLLVGSRISGHFVFGHVDSQLKIIERVEHEGCLSFAVSIAPENSVLIAPKGSVSLNGVSLTVGSVNSEFFEVYIISHTAQVTNLGSLKVGDSLNVEYDMLARYVQSTVQNKLSVKQDITLQFLKDTGFLEQ